ncbi:hypothetical protein ANCDUO_20555, partial [Ancylostoma duodenale]
MTRRYAAKNEKNEWFIKRKRSRVSFRGTLRYCSLAVHQRLEQGRVDDLWSWAFMAVELRDPLPWAHLMHPETVQAVKEETPIEKLCSTGTSRIFIPIMKHFQKLGYYDRPDYQMIFNTRGPHDAVHFAAGPHSGCLLRPMINRSPPRSLPKTCRATG